MMTCLAATLLALILNYLPSSEGALSPPLNLSVEVLDFKALARWLPGPGNPKGTRYSLEFVDIGHFASSQWHQIGNCTNISSTQCHLIFNQRILTEYFLRVGAEWKDERSEWTCLPRSIQPYKYTLLSAPNLTVLAEQHSISVFLSHPVQSLMDVRMRFSVDLFLKIDNKAEKHIAQNITTRSSHFKNLPPGYYCINASAFLTAEGLKSKANATMCVLLNQDHDGKVWVVVVGVLLLLSIPAGVGLALIYCYVKPNSCISKALHCIGTGMVQTLNFKEFQALPISRIFTDECMPVHQETVKNLSQGYSGGKGIRFGSVEKNKEGFLSQKEGDEADQDTPPVPYLYSTALKMEEIGECHSDDLTPRASFSGASLRSGQNTEIGNTSTQNSGFFGEYSEQTYSSEEEMESLSSDDICGADYEPRPDPRCMSNLRHSEH